MPRSSDCSPVQPTHALEAPASSVPRHKRCTLHLVTSRVLKRLIVRLLHRQLGACDTQRPTLAAAKTGMRVGQSTPAEQATMAPFTVCKQPRHPKSVVSHMRNGSAPRCRCGRRSVAARAEEPTPVGMEGKGQNFEAVKDIDAIMKALPHRCGLFMCFDQAQHERSG